jgi:hypothetical protein
MKFKSCWMASVRSRRPFLWVSIVLAALLAGCGQSPYPPDWAPVKTRWFSCPVIAGTYFLGIHGDDAATRILASIPGFNRLLGGRGVTDTDILVIQQDSDRRLHLRLGSSGLGSSGYPSGLQFDPSDRWSLISREMTDAQFLAALKAAGGDAREIASFDRSEQHCSFGWLELPGEGDIPVRLATDEEGFLIAQGAHLQKVQFDLWCGDGCRGIPLGHRKKRDWARLVSFSPAAVTVSSVYSHERRPAGRFDLGSRRIDGWERELDATAAAYIFGSMGGITGEVRATPGVAYHHSAEVTLSAPTRDALVEVLRRFNRPSQFSGFAVRAYSGMDSQPQTVRVVMSYETFRTDEALEPMRATVKARLPQGATLVGLQGRDRPTAIIYVSPRISPTILEQRGGVPFPWRSLRILDTVDPNGGTFVRVWLDDGA